MRLRVGLPVDSSRFNIGDNVVDSMACASPKSFHGPGAFIPKGEPHKISEMGRINFISTGRRAARRFGMQR